MASKSKDTTAYTWSGFLSLGVAWGIAVGYAIADLGTESNGLLLYYGTYPNHRSFVTCCLLICPGLGLLAGLLLDYLVQWSPLRIKLLKNGRKLLLASIFFFVLLHFFVNSSVQGVRE